MPRIEYLEDIENFLQEVLDEDNRPTVRVQGAGQAAMGPQGPRMDAVVVLTHLSDTGVIREAFDRVGNCDASKQDECDKLQARMNVVMETLEEKAKNAGCLVLKGRWVP